MKRDKKLEKRLRDAVYSIADQVNSLESPDQFEILDAQVLSGLNKDIKDITLIVAYGGPTIEVKLGSFIVKGNWGRYEFETRVDSEKCLMLLDYYTEIWECSK